MNGKCLQHTLKYYMYYIHRSQSKAQMTYIFQTYITHILYNTENLKVNKQLTCELIITAGSWSDWQCTSRSVCVCVNVSIHLVTFTFSLFRMFDYGMRQCKWSRFDLHGSVCSQQWSMACWLTIILGHTSFVKSL